MEGAVTSPGAVVEAAAAVSHRLEAAGAAEILHREAAGAVEILHPEAAGAAEILHLEAAGASPTSDDLLMPLSRQATRPRSSGRSRPASRVHTPL